MPQFWKRTRLTLEHLEPRDCPALSVLFTGGNLFILGRPDTIPINDTNDGLNIQVTSSTGAVTVTEVENGAVIANFGTYIVRNNLYLGLTDYSTDINVDLNGQRLYSNLIMNLGLGDQSPSGALVFGIPNPINIYDSTNSGTASVAGNITVVNGSGVEIVSIGANALLSPSTNGITVDGNVNASLYDGIDNRFLGTGNNLFISGTTTVLGSVNTSGVENVTVGEDVSNDSTTIMGNLNVTNAAALNEGIVQVYGTVGGNVNVQGSRSTGTFLPDELILGSLITPTTVGGNVTANLTASVNDEFDVSAISTIQGNVAYSGVGASVLTLNGTVLGNTVLALSGANNTVSSNQGAFFSGDMQIYAAGNGNNDLSQFNPTLQGNLTLNFGNGNNNFGFAGNMDGGTLAATFGNGDNTVTLDSATGLFALKAQFGSGANTLSFNANLLSSGDIEFAPNAGLDVINQTGAISGPFKLVNYP